MKLKIYHTFLMTFLFAVTLTIMMLFGFSCYDIAFNTEKPVDSIIFIVCFLFLIAFAIMHIVNTFISFKKGSAFMVGIVYDEYKKINPRGLFICSVGLALGIAGFVLSIVAINDHSIFLGATPAPLKLMIMSLSILLMGDMIFVLAYPSVGKLDISYKAKGF